MATVSLPSLAAAGAASYEARPAWWRRAHSYSLPATVVAQIGCVWSVVSFLRYQEQYGWGPGLYDLTVPAMVGIILAQCFLLGVWAALGGLATVPRWLVVSAVYVAGALVVIKTLFGATEVINNASEILILGGAVMAGFAAVLLPLRRLAGWRIDFDAAYHPRPARRRGQIALMDFAAMFCAVALPLTLCRVLIESDAEEGASMILIMGMLSLVVLLTAAPVAYAALARQQTILVTLAAAGWVLAMSWGQSLLSTAVPDLNIFDGSPIVAGMQWPMLAFHVGIAAAVAAPLVALRLCGLKLLTIDGR